MAFATVDEVAIRLGYDLTEKQVAQAELLLTIATGIIAGALGKDDAWAAALDPVPAILLGVTLDMVAGVMENPGGARSESETLGAYSHTTSYTDGAHGMLLTDDWLRLCRLAVFGRRSGTFMPGTTVDLVLELTETGEIAEFPAT